MVTAFCPLTKYAQVKNRKPSCTSCACSRESNMSRLLPGTPQEIYSTSTHYFPYSSYGPDITLVTNASTRFIFTPFCYFAYYDQQTANIKNNAAVKMAIFSHTVFLPFICVEMFFFFISVDDYFLFCFLQAHGGTGFSSAHNPRLRARASRWRAGRV